jgi:hypothetical protein
MKTEQIVEFLEGLTNQARQGNLTALAVAYRFNGQAPVAFKAEGPDGTMMPRGAVVPERPLPVDLDDILRS